MEQQSKYLAVISERGTIRIDPHPEIEVRGGYWRNGFGRYPVGTEMPSWQLFDKQMNGLKIAVFEKGNAEHEKTLAHLIAKAESKAPGVVQLLAS